MFVLEKNVALDSIFKEELDVELEIIDFVIIYRVCIYVVLIRM